MTCGLGRSLHVPRVLKVNEALSIDAESFTHPLYCNQAWKVSCSLLMEDDDHRRETAVQDFCAAHSTRKATTGLRMEPRVPSESLKNTEIVSVLVPCKRSNILLIQSSSVTLLYLTLEQRSVSNNITNKVPDLNTQTLTG